MQFTDFLEKKVCPQGFPARGYAGIAGILLCDVTWEFIRGLAANRMRQKPTHSGHDAHPGVHLFSAYLL